MANKLAILIKENRILRRLIVPKKVKITGKSFCSGKTGRTAAREIF